MISRRRFLWVAGLAAVGGAGTVPRAGTAGPVTVDDIGDRIQTLPKGQLPEFAELRAAGVRGAYRYAADQGRDLDFMPCYCGCGQFGHRSNHDCYIKARNRDGTLTFTSHAAT